MKVNEVSMEVYGFCLCEGDEVVIVVVAGREAGLVMLKV
jgi:hypothetical protein